MDGGTLWMPLYIDYMCIFGCRVIWQLDIRADQFRIARADTGTGTKSVVCRPFVSVAVYAFFFRRNARTSSTNFHSVVFII